MKIFLYDSLSKLKKEFIPIDPKKIRIYACGPTVYNYAHIGNARMSVVTDLLVNILKTKFHEVVFVSNITDVDDKIIEASIREKKPINEITTKYHKIYNQDMKMLGVKKPDFQPKATEHIQEMIAMIHRLLKNDCAYIEDNHVLFDVSKYEHYGCLSKRTKEEQIAGNRIDVGEYKKNSEDFVLWKPSKKNEPGWESPWGYGRPGWHIECSAMSEKCLGIPFDIHCGGIDLTFPHHENEIAQSCSAFKKNSDPQNFCKFWFHNGFVTVDGEKMSKSLGNITLINDLLSKYSGSVIRLSLLSSHYRQPLDWSTKILEQSKKTLKKFENFFDKLPSDFNLKDLDGDFDNEFLESLYDDLNTPRALASLNKLFDKVKAVNKENKKIILSLAKCFKLLGINLNKKSYESNFVTKNENKIVLDLIKEREEARKLKDFQRADNIRDKLKKMNINIEDSAEGTKWIKNE
tara:strand:+ start:370 stop:1755 length:1386 start_codon:yes stop_codon:yes gene_type:complete